MIVHELSFGKIISIDRKSSVPIYQQIAGGMIKIIREGLLKQGSSIPVSRRMAEILQVHRKTIIAAYEELKAQDWVETIDRGKIIVSRNLPQLHPHRFTPNTKPDPYNSENVPFFMKERDAEPEGGKEKGNYRIVVNDGFPDPRIAPVDNFLKEYKSFLKKSYAQGLFMHSDAAGSLNLRKEIALLLTETRKLNINTKNILLTRGAQTAIYIAARMILRPGATVIVGEPNYLFANKVFTNLGARLIKVKVDEHGIDVDAIAQICKVQRPDLLYVIPHHHHPTTVTLTAERRMKLLHLIREYKIPVIEDDYDYDFHYNKTPILPLASDDHGGFVLYVGSITKSFASAVRIGYLIGSPDFIRYSSGFREMMDLRGDVLMEEAMAVLYKNGEMQKHLNRSVRIYHQRRDRFCSLLSSELNGLVSFKMPPGGMAVWVSFDKGRKLADIASKASLEGIFMNDGSFYNSGSLDYNALRMGFASMNDSEMMELVMALKQL